MRPPKVRFQIASDIHFEKIGFKSIKDIITPDAPYIIIPGDLGRVENFERYSNILKEICSLFKQVVLVPGNHEYYNSKDWTIGEINKKLKSFQNTFPNLTVLLNETVTIEDITIYGSIFWSKAVDDTCMSKRLFVIDPKSSELLNVTKDIYNSMHQDCIRDLQDVVGLAKQKGKRLVVVTHYPPTFDGVLAPKHAVNGPKDPKNFMYCSNNDEFLKSQNILVWVYGHTGHNGIKGKLVTNQMDAQGCMKDAVLKIDKW